MDYLDKFKQYLKEGESKPDYLDTDGDGNTEEPMTSALKSKNEEEELEEMNVTGNIDGGEGPPKTPYAFHDNDKKGKKKQKDNAETATDYELVKDSLYKRMIHQMENLNEVSYRDYKKDPTSTPQQKVNRGIMEVNKMLAEIEKIVNNNLRLKTETGVQSNHFWKTTGRRFSKINERMLRVANRLKELSQ